LKSEFESGVVFSQITNLADNGVVTNQYWDTGELKKTFGARTYTVEYTYDYAGRLKTMLAGTGTTTWNYDANRGFLTSKIYADGKRHDVFEFGNW